METYTQYNNSVDTHVKSQAGCNRFIGLVAARLQSIEMYDTFKIQAEYIFNLHKAVYGFREVDIETIRNFEHTVCVEFIKNFDEMCSNSQKYTAESFKKELGRLLNRLTKSYSITLDRLNKAKAEKQNTPVVKVNNVKDTGTGINTTKISTPATMNKGLAPISLDVKPSTKVNTVTKKGSKRFTVNPASQTFNKSTYMDSIQCDSSSIPKAFEKNLPWALTQFPDKEINEKLRECMKYHRSLEQFISTEYDAIVRFENLVTTYYIELVFNLVSIPQPLADTEEKYEETRENLHRVTDDYLRALKDLLDKFMQKINLSNQTQISTFKTIVDNIV